MPSRAGRASVIEDWAVFSSEMIASIEAWTVPLAANADPITSECVLVVAIALPF